MSTRTRTIRPLRPEEVGLALDWAAAEGWNPGLSDGPCFLTQDPEAFLLVEVEGEPAAVISAARYGAGFGFIGFYICRPGMRGQGHGWAVWQAAMQRLQGQLIGLDGVVAQQENYQRSGFALAWRNIRYQAEQALAPEASQEGVIPAAGLPLAEIAALDSRAFPAPRDGFWGAWIAAPGHVALALRRGTRLSGFAVLRPCRSGAKIGPLLAEDPDAARTLFAALLARAPVGPVALDLPEPNADARAMAEAAGMAPVFETARMYAGGPAPATDLRLVYGLTSFELG
jgi:RimJ/RimL family protein N-acetyltransferase